jgi:hypothetical protein
MDKGNAVALVMLYADVGRCRDWDCGSRLVDFRVDEIRHMGLAPLILDSRRRKPEVLGSKLVLIREC